MENFLVDPKEMMFHFDRGIVEKYIADVGTIPFEHNYPHFQFTRKGVRYYCSMVSEKGLHCYFEKNGKKEPKVVSFYDLTTPQFEKLIVHINNYMKWEF